MSSGNSVFVDLRALDATTATIAAALARRAGQAPDALAFAAAGERLSYGQLQRDAEALAAGLAQTGVRAGDRVALVLPAGLDFVRAFFALSHLAAVPCAFDPHVPPETTARRIARIRPALALLGGTTVSPQALACASHGIASQALAAVPCDAAAVAPPPVGDTAFIQPTSGTSGEPQAAVISHRNLLASLQTARDVWSIGPADVLVSWVPPWHDLGLLRFILGPVYFGAPCHLVTPAVRTLPEWLETVARVRATITGAPDFAYRLAARLVDPRGLDLRSLRCATSGGEPVRHSTIQAFEQRFGLTGVIRPGYGLAEATLGVSCVRPGEPLRQDAQGNVACGRAMPGVTLRIAAAPGQPGEILVRGESVFEGYFDAPEASRETLRDAWLHTGDIGRLDPDGHLYVLGRQRALLKRGGAALAPREFEEAAEQVAGVRLAAAVSIPAASEATTETIVVAVEVDPSAAPEQVAAAVDAAVEAALGWGPTGVVVLRPRTIPRTANGKLRHAVLRQMLTEGGLERSDRLVFRSGGARSGE